MQKHKELSVAADAVQAFCKVLYISMVSMMSRHDGVVDTTLLGNTKRWIAGAKPFIKEYPVDGYNTLIEELLRDESVDEDTAIDVGNSIKEIIKGLNSDRTVPNDKLRMIADLGAWLRNGSESAYRRLEAKVSSLQEPMLNQIFVKKIGSQKPAERALERIVKKITGSPGNVIVDADVLKKLSEKNPDVKKEYDRLRREFNVTWQNALQAYVRKSGKPFVDYDEALKFLASKGLKHTLPSGFKGYIDDSRKLYTKNKKQVAITPGPLFPKVIMNPNPTPENDWVFRPVKADGTVGTHQYTVEHNINARKSKYVNIEKLRASILKMRNKWLPIVKSPNVLDTREGVAALIIEMCLQFAARIGGSGNEAHGKPTFGLSTLRVKHVRVAPNQVVISYLGKDGVQQKHVLTNTDVIHRRLIVLVKDLVKDKKPSDFVFTVQSRGRVVPVTNVDVNRVYKKLGAPPGVTIKSLRTLKGTVLFSQLLEKLFKTKSSFSTATAANEVFKNLSMQVGKALGHVRNGVGGPKVTGATAVAAYIDPNVQARFFDTYNLRYPPFLEKLLAE
jgi:DNA topoisomerase-1